MPSSEDSNKAFNEATTGVLQILARALQLTDGVASHLDMVKEMANIMTRAFQTHAWSATVIPPILLLAAMELMEHVDRVSQTSFLSVERHQLYLKAHKAITGLIPAPISQAPPVKLPTDPAALPSVVAKSKKPGSDSDEVEIVEGMTQSDDLRKRKRTSSGATESEPVAASNQAAKDAIALVMAENDMAKDVAPGNTDTMPTRPKGKPKSKQVEIVILSRSDITMDRKGKGKEVVLPVEMDWRDHGWKKSRAVSSNRPPIKGNHLSTESPPMAPAGDQWKPWYEAQKQASTVATMVKRQKSQGMSKEHQVTATAESVGDVGMALEADIRANTTIAAVPHTPPRQSQSPLSFAGDMDIDLVGDTVARDLQAMTLEVKTDSKSLLTVVQDTINELQTQVADIRTQNAEMAELIQNMNGRLAAQDTDIRAMEKMHAKMAILQEEVKALHAESQTRDSQLRNADAMLTAQGNCTAVLMDAYESICQCVVPNQTVPHFSNATFFPPASQSAPYSQGMSAGQAQVMEQLYFNLTPVPSTIAGNSVSNIAEPSGSQINCPSSESASGRGPT
ncbi:uncharacterized protein F5891DRAFT_1204396 [Suillus fuscotomentosus]|uniref:Uncharacterized protein n=1 Tax=Suillus fuscotomentosus TaxID=1912939 RepID=A0AAD4DMF2_9AGAM|nr:uncharacterized protein F5891DRAFT_1204396 [Suillus fuscotomentosus]KAG1879007.1 hypothetical protein F5891DRAFT_1204396 [Suillus fuscotomentosus]